MTTMARHLESKAPGLVSWTICGDGPDLDALKMLSAGLPIEVMGWTSPERQVEVRSRCQAVIVPTQGSCAEGMSMAAIEAILSGRPVILNPIVPALEVLEPACEVAEPDDPLSHAEAVFRLAADPDYWAAKRDACAGLEARFYDPGHGLSAALWTMLLPETLRNPFDGRDAEPRPPFVAAASQVS